MAAVRCNACGWGVGRARRRAGQGRHRDTPNPGSCTARVPQRLPAGDDVAGKAAANLGGGLPHNLHSDVVREAWRSVSGQSAEWPLGRLHAWNTMPSQTLCHWPAHGGLRCTCLRKVAGVGVKALCGVVQALLSHPQVNLWEGTGQESHVKSSSEGGPTQPG